MKRKNNWMAIVLALVLVAGLTVGFLLLGQGNRGNTAVTPAAASAFSTQEVTAAATTAAQQPQQINLATPSDAVELADPPHVDLSRFNSNMAFATLMNMAVDTGPYIGQTVKMRGLYYSVTFQETGDVMHLLYVGDEAACCGIGLEFRLTGNPKHPEDYPPEYSIVEVTGIFGTFQFGDQTYPYLTANDFVMVEEPTDLYQRRGG
ncbi:MAG TPA: hypothetical protein GX006_03955 [Clostridiales bacterium]|jgi:hypothetical protein|nr:hypothetical protein [Clostridiales bacterium]